MAGDFRDLRVWEEAMRLAESVYAATSQFPGDERFGLTQQLRRAAVSVASCIAEGNGRETTADYLRFLSMANGSLSELRTQLMLAQRLDLATEATLSRSLQQTVSVSMLLQSLRNALKSKLAENSRSPFPVPRSRSRSP